MPDDGFKLPGSSYEEVVKIVLAYHHSGDNAAPADVGRLAGVDATTISRNNGFLVATGILIEGRARKKVLTDVGADLAKATEFQVAEDIERAWRRVVLTTSFLVQLIAAVRVRNGMDPESLASHIAYSAGQKKNKGSMTGARTVARILRESGLLAEEGGKLVASIEADMDEQVEPSSSASAPTPVPRPATTKFYGGGVAVGGGDNWTRLLGSSVNLPAEPGGIQIQIQIQVGVEDIDLLAPKLRQFFDDLSAGPSAVEEPGQENVETADE